MLKIGDIVKVISKTHQNDTLMEFVKIGTICRVVDICKETIDDTYCYGIVPVCEQDEFPYYYLEDELERGRMEWTKE